MENRRCLKVTTHFSCSSHQFNRSTCRRSRHNRPCGHSRARPRPPSCRSHILHVRSHHNRPCGHSRARPQPPSCHSHIRHVHSRHNHPCGHNRAQPQPPSSRGGSSHRWRREQHSHRSKSRGRHKCG